MSQFLGGAIGVAIAQALFNNRLLSALAEHAPGVDAQIVLHTGATDLRDAFPEQDVPGVIAAYLDGLRWVWIITIAMIGFALLVSVLDYLPSKGEEGDEDSAVKKHAGDGAEPFGIMA